MPQCIFCNQSANTREHVWPKWIHERKEFGQIHHKIGAGPLRLVDPELRVRVVCGDCNNGWMSRLQGENITHLSPMAFHGFTLQLDLEQRTHIARWITMTAMIADSIKGRNSPDIFYTKVERSSFREGGEIPDRTTVWLGRYEQVSLGIFGTDLYLFSPDGQSRGSGMVTTIIAGQVVAQILTLHPNSEVRQLDIVDVAPKPGDWDNLLVPIWPLANRTIEWPPTRALTRRLGPDCIVNAVERWKLGSNLTEMRYRPQDGQE